MEMPQPPKSLQIEAGLLKLPPRGYWTWTRVSAIGPPPSSNTMPDTSYRPGMTGEVGGGDGDIDGAVGDGPHPDTSSTHRTATRMCPPFLSRCPTTLSNGGSDTVGRCNPVAGWSSESMPMCDQCHRLVENPAFLRRFSPRRVDPDLAVRHRHAARIASNHEW